MGFNVLPSTKPAPWGLLMRNPPPWRWAGGGQRNRPRGGRALKVEGLGLSVECQFSLNSQHSSLNIPAASTRLFCPLEEWVLCGRIADWVCLRRLHAKKGWTPEIHPFHRRLKTYLLVCSVPPYQNTPNSTFRICRAYSIVACRIELLAFEQVVHVIVDLV